MDLRGAGAMGVVDDYCGSSSGGCLARADAALCSAQAPQELVEAGVDDDGRREGGWRIANRR